MSAKHEKTRGPSPFSDDLERNPGIGQSPGSFATGEPPEAIEGANTSEGDVENDANSAGGVRERQPMRTNR